MTKTLNVAILGFGLSGSTFHAPLISSLPQFNLTHILSRQKEKINQLYPQINVATTLEEILTNPIIDLVINTLPNCEHYAVTKQCLLAGKHVVVEKPFVIYSHEGRELIKLAHEKQLILSVYHNRRFDNGLLTLKNNLAKLGNIYLYEAYFDRFRPEVNLSKWREQDDDGSGILYDLGSHLIDQALYLFGIPLNIHADLTKQRPHAQTIDYFNLIFTYPQHKVILGSCSVMAQPRPVIAAYGDQGSYVKYGLDPQENQLRAGLTPLDDNFGIEEEHHTGKLIILQNDNTLSEDRCASISGCYHEYYKQLHASIINQTLPPVTAEDALKVIELIEKALNKAKHNEQN